MKDPGRLAREGALSSKVLRADLSVTQVVGTYGLELRPPGGETETGEAQLTEVPCSPRISAEADSGSGMATGRCLDGPAFKQVAPRGLRPVSGKRENVSAFPQGDRNALVEF